MSDGTSSQADALVWTDAARVPLVRRVLAGLGEVTVRAVGGPRRSGLAELAAPFNAEVDDDLRRMLRQRPARFLLLATSEGVGPAALQPVQQAGLRLLNLEPLAPELAADAAAVPLPWLRMSPAWLAATEPEEALGPVRSLHITELGPSDAGSLYARLHDAMELTIHLLGMPGSVDASLTGALPEPPDELTGLTGHLTVHLRYSTNAAATLHCSDRAGRWQRRVDALGAEAQLAMDDTGYTLLTGEGRELDSRPAEPTPVGADELIVRQWRKLLTSAQPPRPVTPKRVFAGCRAALLSCRTGELESPETFLQMAGG